MPSHPIPWIIESTLYININIYIWQCFPLSVTKSPIFVVRLFMRFFAFTPPYVKNNSTVPRCCYKRYSSLEYRCCTWTDWVNLPPARWWYPFWNQREGDGQLNKIRLTEKRRRQLERSSLSWTQCTWAAVVGVDVVVIRSVVVANRYKHILLLLLLLLLSLLFFLPYQWHVDDNGRRKAIRCNLLYSLSTPSPSSIHYYIL